MGRAKAEMTSPDVMKFARSLADDDAPMSLLKRRAINVGSGDRT